MAAERLDGKRAKFVSRAGQAFERMFGADGQNGLVTFAQREDRACEVTDELARWLMAEHIALDPSGPSSVEAICPLCGVPTMPILYDDRNRPESGFLLAATSHRRCSLWELPSGLSLLARHAPQPAERTLQLLEHGVHGRYRIDQPAEFLFPVPREGYLQVGREYVPKVVPQDAFHLQLAGEEAGDLRLVYLHLSHPPHVVVIPDLLALHQGAKFLGEDFLEALDGHREVGIVGIGA